MPAGHSNARLGRADDRQVALVHSLAVRLLGDADDAEDVVEETFWGGCGDRPHVTTRRAAQVDVALRAPLRAVAHSIRLRCAAVPERTSSRTDDDDHDVAVASPENVSPLGHVEQSEQRDLCDLVR